MDKPKTMKQLFNAKKKAVQKMNAIGKELDRMIEDKYGFHYSPTDDDPIIDTLDYGHNSISFKDFENRMNQYKQAFDKGEDYPVIP